MTAEDPMQLRTLVWKQIREGAFAEAEETLEALLAQTDPDDALEVFHLLSMLAGTLNSRKRLTEATDTLRRALAEARRPDPKGKAVEVARYMRCRQHLLCGEPELALHEAEPVPHDVGYTQSLLQAVVAEALWQLGRPDESRSAAALALDLAPDEDHQRSLAEQLAYIIERS
jgi:tetratricopeptide (TPR) repeat protein